MARRSRGSGHTRRSGSGRWKARALGAALLLAVLAGGAAWWLARDWRPSRAQMPMQGVLLGAADGAVTAAALRGAGAGFAYLEASAGAQGRDPRFAANLAELGSSGLPLGAVHAYDPCIAADRQAANFVTIVPRDPAQLPPAIALSKLASACGDPVIEAGVESELMTFINQVENHTGQAVVLHVSAEFEETYGIAARIERNLWLERDFLEPEYAGRPWTLWTANRHLRVGVGEGPLRWVVRR